MNTIADSNFKKLIGVWYTTGSITLDQKTHVIEGTDRYELILDNNYIVHHADVKLGETRSQTMEIIKFDQTLNKAIMQYYDSNGEDGTMIGSILNNEFIIEGKDLKFVGEFNADNTRIKGTWYLRSTNKCWIDYIDLLLEKIEEKRR